MANNRYYLHCPCGENRYLGKSMGSGIYGPGSFTQSLEDNNQESADLLFGIYEWMWEHFIANHAKLSVDAAGPEWVKGEILKVLTEYDERVK